MRLRSTTYQADAERPGARGENGAATGGRPYARLGERYAARVRDTDLTTACSVARRDYVAELTITTLGSRMTNPGYRAKSSTLNVRT